MEKKVARPQPRVSADAPDSKYRLINRAELGRIVPLKSLALSRAIEAGRLPKPIAINGRVHLWMLSEVEAAIEKLAAERGSAKQEGAL